MAGTGDRPGAAEAGRWLDVAREAWHAQAAVTRSAVEVARSAATGELDPVTATRAYAQAVRRGGERYWRTASRLGAEYAQGLAALGQQVTGDLLEEVSAARRRRTPAAHHGHASAAPPTAGTWPAAGSDARATTSDGATAQPAGLVLRGRLGERATGSITVVNRHPRSRRVEISAGTVVDEHGADVVGAAVELAPARTTLPAGEEAEVAVGLELVPGLFEVGHGYLVTLQVSGGDDATVVCSVVVEP